MNGDVCRWSLPISFVYTHAHYISTPIAADRYCTHIMVACHVVYHARNDTLSHAGEDTKEHYREARRVLRKAPSCHEKLRIPETCHSPPPLSSLAVHPVACPYMAHSHPCNCVGSTGGLEQEQLLRVPGASAWCMGECRVHGGVSSAWESTGCMGECRVPSASTGCMGEYSVCGKV